MQAKYICNGQSYIKSLKTVPVNIKSSRKKKWDTVLHMNLTYGTLFILMLRGSEKKIQMGGQTTMAKNSRTSFRLFPVQLSPPLHSSLRYDWTCKFNFQWDNHNHLKLLTAAFETTVFWSHSIRTSRNVALFLSIACKTFPETNNHKMRIKTYKSC